MSQIIRQQENGDWFGYSTVVEDIIFYQASREDIIEFMLEQRREELERRVDQIEENGCTLPKTNLSKMADDCIEKSSFEVNADGKLVEG